MMTNSRTKTSNASSAQGDAHKPKKSGDHSTDVPPMPAESGKPHEGQQGHAGSGGSASLESVGQSQSDRAAGSSG